MQIEFARDLRTSSSPLLKKSAAPERELIDFVMLPNNKS
jgi:hypothetical protein